MTDLLDQYALAYIAGNPMPEGASAREHADYALMFARVALSARDEAFKKARGEK